MYVYKDDADINVDNDNVSDNNDDKDINFRNKMNSNRLYHIYIIKFIWLIIARTRVLAEAVVDFRLRTFHCWLPVAHVSLWNDE